jgi:isopentenyl diphosphate isomerase/L-lactate dehydrogenase-like FMN-dependent dehydrogenase
MFRERSSPEADRITPVPQRRQFLQWLAASPAAGALGAELPEFFLSSPSDAINVMEFEAAARRALPPAHFGYMATGVDDDVTLQANRKGFERFKLRPRRLVDVRDLRVNTTLLGTPLDWPVMIAPVGNQKAFHPQGEVAVARAAGQCKTQMILSTMTTSPIEEVVKAAGGPVWYQLYATSRWDVTEVLVGRAEAAGSPVICLTVDTNSGRRTDTLERSKRLDSRQCTACHTPGKFFLRKSMFSGLDTTDLSSGNPGMDWRFIDKLRKLVKGKLVIKGLETAEDAALACQAGIDGIIVSNHGARATETGRGTIECLPEVLQAVNGRVPVVIDGGFRRGTDIFKALALGAKAVCVGRPVLWGLAAFGTPGVDRVLELLRAEFELVMRQCGARSVAELHSGFVTT